MREEFHFKSNNQYVKNSAFKGAIDIIDFIEYIEKREAAHLAYFSISNFIIKS